MIQIVLVSVLCLTAVHGTFSCPNPCQTTNSANTNCTGITDSNINSAVGQYLAAQASAECTYGPIEDWNTGSVTNMGSLFYNKPSSDWNIDISGWDTSSVTNMFQMFQGVKTSNNISIGDISSWDTSSVTTMEAMFKDADLNPDLSAWNVGSVEDMKDMFKENYDFNSDISNWDVSSVTDMQGMFHEAVEFNQPLANWSDKLDNVQFMINMFKDAEGFMQDLSSWCLIPASDGGALLASNGFWDGSSMSPAERPILDGSCAATLSPATNSPATQSPATNSPATQSPATPEPTPYPVTSNPTTAIQVINDPHVIYPSPDSSKKNTDCKITRFGEFKIMEYEGNPNFGNDWKQQMIAGHFFHGTELGGYMDAISIDCGATTAVVTLHKRFLPSEAAKPAASVRYYDRSRNGLQLPKDETGEFTKNSTLTKIEKGKFSSFFCETNKHHMEVEITARSKYGKGENGTARLDMVIPGYDVENVIGGLVKECSQECLSHLPHGPINRYTGLTSGDCFETVEENESDVEEKSTTKAKKPTSPDEGTRNAARRHSILSQKAHSMRKRMQKTMQSLKPMETQV